MLRSLSSALVLVSLAASVVAAQSPTVDELLLRTNLGDRLTLVRADGATTQGRLVAVTPTELVLRTTEDRKITVAVAGVRTVTKVVNDPLRNGALVGFGIGAAAGVVAGLLTKADGGTAGYVIWGSGVFASIGMAVDALLRDSTVIYRAPPLSWMPLVTPRGAGVTLVVRW